MTPVHGIYPGMYRHHKGALYVFAGIAVDSNNATAGRLLVEYFSTTTGQKHSRALEEFNAEIVWPDGVTRRRFMRVESSIEEPQAFELLKELRNSNFVSQSCAGNSDDRFPDFCRCPEHTLFRKVDKFLAPHPQEPS